MRDARHLRGDREFALIEAIAAALCDELGGVIEEQPGFHNESEAGQVNRAFRVMARTTLRTIAPADQDLSALLSRVLGLLARRRLEGACSKPTRSITCSVWSWTDATTGSRS